MKDSQFCTPIGTGVILKVHKVDETRGGLKLPDAVSGMQSYETPIATVVCVGPDCKQVKVGDEVLAAASLSCCQVKYEGKDYVMTYEPQLIGILNKVER